MKSKHSPTYHIATDDRGRLFWVGALHFNLYPPAIDPHQYCRDNRWRRAPGPVPSHQWYGHISPPFATPTHPRMSRINNPPSYQPSFIEMPCSCSNGHRSTAPLSSAAVPWLCHGCEWLCCVSVQNLRIPTYDNRREVVGYYFLLSAAAEFQYTPICSWYNFATTRGTECRTMLELDKIIIKTIVKKSIDLELFSLRSGYAKRVLIGTNRTN